MCTKSIVSLLIASRAIAVLSISVFLLQLPPQLKVGKSACFETCELAHYSLPSLYTSQTLKHPQGRYLYKGQTEKLKHSNNHEFIV